MPPRKPRAPRSPSAGKVTRLPLAPPPDTERERIDQALAEMALAVASTQALSESHRAQLTILVSLLQAKACFLLELDAARGQLQIACSRGRNDARIVAVTPGEGPVGRAFSERRVVREGQLIAAPVPGAEAPLGCLVVLDSKLGLSDSLVLAFAAHIASGWEVARLRDEASRRSKDLQTAIAGLKSLEKNREELLSNVSHDLKNPLTTVKAYLTMLGQGKLGELPERQLRAVQTCERNADRLLRMVQDLLLLSRLQSGKMILNQRPFGLKALTQDIIQGLTPVAEQARVRMALGPSSEVFIRGDRERMAEAFTHLIEHAIHQCELGGTVQIAVRSPDGALAEITLHDDGLGMEADQVEHLFDAFHRSTVPAEDRHRGATLGLPIVGKVVQLHGGRIETQSRLGEGTRFRVVLPAFAAAVSRSAEVAPPRSGEILLVEDDRDCREVLIELLEQEGYSVMSAPTVDEALEQLKVCRPAMVLLDLRLAQEDGRSVLRHVRGTPGLEDVAVFLISGASEVAALSTGTGLDRIDGFFEKPLQLGKLLDTVAAVVRPIRAVPR